MILLLHERFDNPFERGRWFRYLDWLLALPQEYDLRVWDRVKELKKETIMPYVSSADRYERYQGQLEGHKQGRREGRCEAIEIALDLRFPDSVAELMPQIKQIEDLDRLHALVLLANRATLADIRAAVSPPK